MTQTLRRERYQKFLVILEKYYQDNPPTADATEFNKLVAKELSEAADSRTEARDPLWDIMHGQAPDSEQAKSIAAVHDVALRLENGLRRNLFPETPEAQKVYKWILEQEAKGQKLETWVEWANGEKRREFTFKYRENPVLIRSDWPQAFTTPQKTETDYQTL